MYINVKIRTEGGTVEAHLLLNEKDYNASTDKEGTVEHIKKADIIHDAATHIKGDSSFGWITKVLAAKWLSMQVAGQEVDISDRRDAHVAGHGPNKPAVVLGTTYSPNQPPVGPSSTAQPANLPPMSAHDPNDLPLKQVPPENILKDINAKTTGRVVSDNEILNPDPSTTRRVVAGETVVHDEKAASDAAQADLATNTREQAVQKQAELDKAKSAKEAADKKAADDKAAADKNKK